MRQSFAFVVLLLLPSVSFAQTEEMIKAVEQKLTTLRWIQSLEAPMGGFYPGARDPREKAQPKPSLRATSAAVRAWKYLGGENLGSKFPNKDKHAAFVLSCFDPKTGGFADTPGSKPDVALTSIGVMAAVELDVPKEKFAKAMDYLKENAKTFEDVRIGAAAVEAWGVKDCPFDLKLWNEITIKEVGKKLPPIKNGGARAIGSLVAFHIRLGLQKDIDSKPKEVAQLLDLGQLADGGWCKEGENASDLETTYRVMRAYYLLKEKPKDSAKLREFIVKCRNKDGGYGAKPGEASTAGGVYFAAIITKWLDDMEKK